MLPDKERLFAGLVLGIEGADRFAITFFLAQIGSFHLLAGKEFDGMAVHVEHIPCDIIQVEQLSSQVLLKKLVTLGGALCKKAIFGGSRAKKRQARQDPEVCLTDGVDSPDALDIPKKRFPDQLKSHLFRWDACCLGGAQISRGFIEGKLLEVRDKKEASHMGAGNTPPEKC